MKLKVKDNKGRIFRVSDECTDTETEVKDETESELTAAEIKKLKKLIPHMDDLLQLLEIEEKEHDTDFAGDELESETEVEEEEKTETVEDDCPDDDIEVEEEEETETVEKFHDSKKSFGATERRKVSDSVETEIEKDNEVALAWAKRYNGGN